MALLDPTAQKLPQSAVLAASAILGFVTAAALLLWLERAPAILLDLKALSAAFICL